MSETMIQYPKDGSYHFVGDLGKFKEANGLMTGQEWYDRFEAQFGMDIFPIWYERNKPDEQHEVLDRETVLKSAKKAAGIE